MMLENSMENEVENIASFSDLKKAYSDYKENYAPSFAQLRKSSQNIAATREQKEQKNESPFLVNQSFGNRGKGRLYNIFVAEKTKTEMVCDILIVCMILMMCITVFCCFATPTIEIGGVTYKGSTLNMYSFIWGDDNSLIKQIMSITTETEIDDAESIGGIMKMVRLFILAVPTAYIVIAILFHLIMTAVNIVKKNFVKIRKSAVSIGTDIFMVYIAFAFFGSVSGGKDIDAYYVGYTVGIGTTVIMLITISMLMGMIIAQFVSQRKLMSKDVKNQWAKSLISVIGWIAIGIVLTFTRIYSIFIYVYTSTVVSVIMNIQKGFQFDNLIFPILNMLIFSTCIIIYRRANVGIKRPCAFLLNIKNGQPPPVVNDKKNKNAVGFVLPVVLSLMSAASVYVLRMPEFGHGWAADIYAELVAMFTISAVGICAMLLFREIKSVALEAEKSL